MPYKSRNQAYAPSYKVSVPVSSASPPCLGRVRNGPVDIGRCSIYQQLRIGAHRCGNRSRWKDRGGLQRCKLGVQCPWGVAQQLGMQQCKRCCSCWRKLTAITAPDAASADAGPAVVAAATAVDGGCAVAQCPFVFQLKELCQGHQLGRDLVS